jgi:hypothetical protein
MWCLPIQLTKTELLHSIEKRNKMPNIPELLQKVSSHIDEDDRRWDEHDKRQEKVFTYLGKLDDKIDILLEFMAKNENVSGRVGTLWDNYNKQSGIINFGKWATEVSIRWGSVLIMVTGGAVALGVFLKKLEGKIITWFS